MSKPTDEELAMEFYLGQYITKKNRHDKRDREEEYSHKCAAEARVQQPTEDQADEDNTEGGRE